MVERYSDNLQRKGLKRRKASPAGMDSPVFKYFFAKISLSDAKDAPPSLMGLWEEQSVSLPSFKGLKLGNKSPPFKWECFSEPLDCPPNERCNAESMVGTMSPLEGNPHPSRAGRKSVNYPCLNI